MSDSPAARLRRYLSAMRGEGLSFEDAWIESLGRLEIDEDVETWCDLIRRYAGVWAEIYQSPEFGTAAACVQIALERLAERESVRPGS